MIENENDILRRVRKIEIKTRGLSNEIFAGKYHTAFRGRGMSFSEVREYRAGDDVRDIDWNVTARSRSPHIKVYEEERELTMMLMVDVSASRMFGSTHFLKKNILTEIAAVVAFSAAQNNDKVGCIFFSDRVEKYIPPKKGRSHILMIIRELIGFRPRSTGTALSEAVRFLTAVMKKRCTAFLLSDFLDPARDGEEFANALKIAGSKHDLVGDPRLRSARSRTARRGHRRAAGRRDGAQGLGRHFVGGRARPLRPRMAAAQRVDRLAAQTQPHRHGDDLDRRRLRGGTHQTLQATMKRPAFLTAAAAALLAAATASAQTPTVEARIVPDSIGIGDTFTLEIDVERDQVQVTEFPLYENDDKLEVVQSLPVDTLSREGRRLRLRKRYVMQAFSEGRYNLGRPGVLYADKNIVDTLYTSDSLRLDVGTFQIDTAKQTIYDLKPQRTLPLRAEEITGYLFGGLFLLLNLAALLFALRYHLSKRGKHLSDLFKPAPPAPPHVEAIRALEGLHNQKLWQNNKHKAYYSGLTDILRRYLAGRYGIGALEMTSDEIIDAVRPLDLPRKSAMELTALLREADLVKFAKATPEAARNEEAYQWAYYFVEETKPVEEQPSAEAEEPLDLTPKNDSHA